MPLPGGQRTICRSYTQVTIIKSINTQINYNNYKHSGVWDLVQKKVLYVSGNPGFGHITRDVPIAKALRAINKDVEISWLAEEPATTFLKSAGESVLPEAARLIYGNTLTDGRSQDTYEFNVIRWWMNLNKQKSDNYSLVKELVDRMGFDLVIGDETFDLTIKFLKDPRAKTFPFVMIYDFVAGKHINYNPVDRMAQYYGNRLWYKILTREPPIADRVLLIGEIEDLPDLKYGLFMPQSKEVAKQSMIPVGYVLPDDIGNYLDQRKVKRDLGYGDEPLIVCSKGGTAIGKVLLDLCVDSFPLVKQKIPDARMMIVCGPEVAPDSIKAPTGVDVKGFVPSLYRHEAAADLCIAQCGLGTMTELMALRRPFIYFPIEKHFEQDEVAGRCEKHRAGVRMAFSQTTPKTLADTIVENIGKEVDYIPIRTDGAQRAAGIINELLLSL